MVARSQLYTPFITNFYRTAWQHFQLVRHELCNVVFMLAGTRNAAVEIVENLSSSQTLASDVIDAVQKACLPTLHENHANIWSNALLQAQILSRFAKLSPALDDTFCVISKGNVAVWKTALLCQLLTGVRWDTVGTNANIKFSEVVHRLRQQNADSANKTLKNNNFISVTTFGMNLHCYILLTMKF